MGKCGPFWIRIASAIILAELKIKRSINSHASEHKIITRWCRKVSAGHEESLMDRCIMTISFGLPPRNVSNTHRCAKQRTSKQMRNIQFTRLKFSRSLTILRLKDPSRCGIIWWKYFNIACNSIAIIYFLLLNWLLFFSLLVLIYFKIYSAECTIMWENIAVGKHDQVFGAYKTLYLDKKKSIIFHKYWLTVFFINCLYLWKYKRNRR